MTSSNSIDHTTRLYRAFHEAGHCAAAFLTHADVELLELPLEGGGRCRIRRNADQRQARFIAAGGYAVELLLYKGGRLVAPGPVELTERGFINLSMANAWDDKKTFFGGDYSEGGKTWPPEMDRQFMLFGWKEVSTQLESWMPAIEATAVRLDAGGILTGTEAREIFAGHG